MGAGLRLSACGLAQQLENPLRYSIGLGLVRRNSAPLRPRLRRGLRPLHSFFLSPRDPLSLGSREGPFWQNPLRFLLSFVFLFLGTFALLMKAEIPGQPLGLDIFRGVGLPPVYRAALRAPPGIFLVMHSVPDRPTG